MDIYVGSLPFKIKEEELKMLFEHYGEVSSVTIIKDKITRQNKGFGFVEMPNVEEALKAIENLNNFGVHERKIVVTRSEKKAPTEDRPMRGYNSKRSSDFNKAGNNKTGFNRSSGGGSNTTGKREFGKGGFKGGTGKAGPGKGGFKKPGGPKRNPS